VVGITLDKQSTYAGIPVNGPFKTDQYRY